MIAAPFIIAIDHREKLPFDFNGIRGDASDDHAEIATHTHTQHLATGDYSIIGLTDRVATEIPRAVVLLRRPAARRDYMLSNSVSVLSKGIKAMIAHATPLINILNGNATELIDANTQFVLWKKEGRGGNPTKVPYQGGWQRRASVTDPATWMPYDSACRFLPYASIYLGDNCGTLNRDFGLGFVLSSTDPFVAVDLDDAFEDRDGRQRLKPHMRAIVDRFGTYGEISPSGNGVRLIGHGQLNGDVNTGRRHRFDDGSIAEIYHDRRFVTITGNRPNERAVGDCQAACDWMMETYFPRRVVATPTGGATVAAMPGDDEILAAIRESRQYVKFGQLWTGRLDAYGGDHSAADLGLCSILGFWAGGDGAAVDRLFRQSGLYRDKWERQDYRESTIARALESCPDPYDWGRERTSSSYIYISSSSTQESSTSTESTEDIRRTGTRELLPGINEPTLTPQYNPCRRAKVFLHKRDAPNQKRCAGFPCRRHHGCDHCGKLWERERFDWYSQIVAQFDAAHHATAADAAAKNRIRQQLKRRGVYYVCVPTGDGGFEIFASTAAPSTVEVSHGQASTTLEEAIKSVPPRGKISGTRALMFSRKKDDETSEWEKEDFQAPLAEVPMPAIRDAARRMCGAAKLFEFNDRERSFVEFTVPDDWDLVDWRQLVALASPDYLDSASIEIVFS